MDYGTKNLNHEHARPAKAAALRQPRRTLEKVAREAVDDGGIRRRTKNCRRSDARHHEHAKSIISRNVHPTYSSPVDQSYRGCEHGCIYCYARPVSVRNLSRRGLRDAPVAKVNAAELLRAELAKPAIAAN